MRPKKPLVADIAEFKPCLVLFLLLSPASPALANHANPMPGTPALAGGRPTFGQGWHALPSNGTATSNGWSLPHGGHSLPGNPTNPVAVTNSAVHAVSTHPLNHFTLGQPNNSAWSGPINASGINRAASGLGALKGGPTFNLMSRAANVLLGSSLFQGNDTVTIDIAGKSQTYHAGMRVTAAEYVAILQVLSGNRQSLTLDGHGTAAGGTFSINQITAGKVGELVVPKGVTALDDFSISKQIHLNGDLINYGTIDGISGGSEFTAGSIFARDITNARGGIISTDLSGVSANSANLSLAPKVDLTLSAQGNISNAGMISSSGVLTLSTVGGSITNSLPNTHGSAAGHATAANNAPAIQAVSDINLIAGNGSLVNTGLVQSTGGNINIGAPNAATNLNINALAATPTKGANNNSVVSGGTFSALAGNINIRSDDLAGANNINMAGGNYLSQQLNINAGAGAVNGYVGNVPGVVSITAGSSQFGAATANLQMGKICVSGDPTYFNTLGNLTLSGVPITNGNDLALIASGDVVVTGGTIDTTDPVTHTSGGKAGDIVIIAGASVTTSGPTSGNNDTTTTLKVTQSGLAGHGSATGGAIDLSAVTAINAFGSITPVNPDGTYPANTNNGAGGRGGSVTLVAFSGTGASARTPGSINLGTTGSINTYAGGPGSSQDGLANGNVLVIAGATSDPVAGAAITLPAMFTGQSPTANQSGISGGTVNISTALPLLSGTLSVTNGTASGATFSAGTTLPTSITIGSVGGVNPITASPAAWETAGAIYALQYINSLTGSPTPNLKLDAGLTVAATFQAEYLAQTGRLAHFTLNGAGPGARQQAAGVDVFAVPVGENIGVDNGSTLSAGFKRITDGMWYQEPDVPGTHHHNFVANSFIGIGFAFAGGQLYVVEDLSTVSTVGHFTPTPIGGTVHAGVGGASGLAFSQAGTNETAATVGGNAIMPISINTTAARGIFEAPTTGANVTLTSGANITVAGAIIANGSAGAFGFFDGITNIFADGGAGGKVTITAQKNISLNGVQATGGLGGASLNTVPVGVGGNGGTVSITSNAGDITILPGYPYVNSLAVAVAGGAGGQAIDPDFAGAAGGNGGAVTLLASAGNIIVSGIDAGGGGGAGGSGGTTGGNGGAGGAGGTISMTASGVVGVQFYINASGGGGGGAGGKNASSGGGGGGGSLGMGGGGGASDINGKGSGGGGAVAEIPGMGGPVIESSDNISSNGVGTGGFGIGGAFGNFGGGGTGGSGTDPGGNGGALGKAGGNSGGHTGGAGGAGGSITVSGGAVVVQGTVKGMWDPYQIRISSVSTTVTYSQGGDSILALGTNGSVSITSGSLPLLYSKDGSTAGNLDFSSTTANVIAAWAPNFTVGSLTNGLGVAGTIEAGSQANAITINGTGKSSPVTTGTFGLSPAAASSFNINANSKTINNGDSVTPAELAALIEVATTGSQSVVLTGGAATGGTINLAFYDVPTAGMSTLNVPAGVTVNGQLNALTFTSSATINGTVALPTFGIFTAPTLTMNGTISSVQGIGFGSGTAISGASINLDAPNGLINFNGNSLSSTADLGTGKGGNISLTANQLSWPTLATQPMILNSNGTGSGSGGSVSLTLTTNVATKIGNGAGQFELNANSGGSGGIGGAVSFTDTNSNLTVDPSQLNVTGTSGTAGSIGLSAASLTYNGASPLTAATASLTTTNGSIASSGTPFITKAGTLNILATSTSAGAGNAFIQQSSGNLVINSTIVGAITATSAGALTINDTTGTVTTSKLTGTSVSINGTAGQDETLNNTGTITASAGNIDVTSTPDALNKGGNLFITGGGTLTASGVVNLTAVTSIDGQSANVLEFTGNQTFNGTTNLGASGGKQQIIVDKSVTVTGNNTVNINSLTLVKNGSITGNPLVLPNNGTIADSVGPINLDKLGTLVFNGTSLAILSAGNITDNGNPVTIDLSSPSSAGGGLILIAGFNFNPPATAGLPPDTSTAYTITSAGSGNISLGNTTIKTSGATLGGNVSAFATGSITLDAINTKGSNGASGSVTVIGQNVTVNAAVDTSNTTPASAGSVTITSASAKTSGSVVVKAGGLTGGAFVPNAPSGSITLAGISAGTQSVTLTAGAAGSSVTSSGAITAGTLSATSGAGGIGTSGSPLITNATTLSLNAGTTGDVFVHDTASSVVLTGSNSANNYNLVMTGGTGSILIGAGQTVTGNAAVNLTAVGAGTIDMQDNAGAINAPVVSLVTAGGAIGPTNAIQLTAPNTSLTFNATTGGNVSIGSPNAITLNTSVGNNITLTASAISTAGSTTATGVLTLNTDLLTVGSSDTLTGTAVAINGVVGQDLTVNNKGNIVATTGNIDIASSADAGENGGNLNLTGGGTMKVVNNATASINLTAAVSPDQFSANIIHFLGSQTFDGNANLFATGNNQSVLIDSGAQITEVNPFFFTVDTTAIINNGPAISGNTKFNTPTGAGTYANDTGPLDLNGLNLTFSGQSLSILSNGDITNSGKTAKIDLSNASGGGGRLFLMAGLAFSPGTGGVTTNPIDTVTTYSITGLSLGNIKLANVDIDTSGSTLGGDIAAYANGSVTLGTLTANGGTSHGGNINIIGQGVTVGAITATGNTPATAGKVNITSAHLQISGSITVSNGIAAGGKFLPGSAIGSIALSGIDAGASSVTLTATGGFLNSSGAITTATLTASGGNGIGGVFNPIVTNASTLSLDASPGGDVHVNDTATAVTLTGTNAAANYVLGMISPAADILVANGQSIVGQASTSLSTPGNITFQNGSTVQGHLISLTASGVLTLPSTISATADVAGVGGAILLSAGTVGWVNSGTQALVLNASGTGSGNGGTVSLTAANALTVGSTAGQIEFIATSGLSGGKGGVAIINTAGAALTFADPTQIKTAPLSAGAGGALFLTAASLSSAVPLAFDESGVGNGSGGTVNITLSGATPVTIGSGAGQLALSANSGAAGGDGGIIQLVTAGTLTVNIGSLKAGPLGTDGNGGTIKLSAASVSNGAAGLLTLNGSGGGADGKGKGDGGVVSITTAQTTAVTVSTGATGQFALFANAGGGGGSGGKVNFTTGGNLTVDPTGLGVLALTGGAGNSNGGTVTLFAGNNGIGTLLFKGSLAVNAAGTGTGGTINLQSNSATVLNIDSISTKNGVTGTLSVSGAGGLADGSISAVNKGGGVTDSQQINAVNNITLMSTGNNGTVTVSKALGNSTTSSIELDAFGTGKVTASKTLQANFVTASSGSGSLGTLTVSGTSAVTPVSVTANTSGKGTVYISNIGPGALDIKSATGAAITAKSLNDLTSSGPITGTTVALSTSSKTTGSINTGGSITGTTITLTTAAPSGSITTGGIISGTAVTLTASGKTSDSITTGAAITASTGSVAIKSSGVGAGLITINLPVTATNGSITLTSSAKTLAGSGIISHADLTAPLGTVTETAVTNLTVDGGILAHSKVSLTAGGVNSVIALSLSARINTNILTGTVALTANGTGGSINANLTSDISAGKSVTLSATKGSIASGVIGVVQTPSLVTMTALNNLTASNTIQALTGVTLKTTSIAATPDTLTVNSISTASGNILIVGAGPNEAISTGATSAISIGTPLLKGAKGAITIEGSNISKTAAETIVLGFASQLSTYVIAPGKSGAGQINVVIGAVPAKNVAGSPPITVGIPAPAGGTATFGLNGIEPLSIGTIFLKGANVVFNTGKLPASSIFLNNVTITADPPFAPLHAAPSSINHIQGIQARPAAPNTSTLIQPIHIVPTPTATAGEAILASTSSVIPALQTGRNPLPGQPVWISETEIASGEIPAFLSSGVELGIVPEVTSLVEIDESQPPTAVHNAPHAVTLNHGSVVFAPVAPTTVVTPNGTVKIDANSLVFVMVSADGLSVYNLHDSHAGAVSVRAGRHNLLLSPGTHLVVTDQSKDTFADINPAQAFAYRSMTETRLGEGLKVFRSEFSLPDAIRAVMPLRQMVRSTHPNARSIARRLVKTTAIIADIGAGSKPYLPIPRRSNTRVACLGGEYLDQAGDSVSVAGR